MARIEEKDHLKKARYQSGASKIKVLMLCHLV